MLVDIDSELLEKFDAYRGNVPVTDYISMVLRASLTRPVPHLANDWTPDRAAKQLADRLEVSVADVERRLRTITK